MRVRVGIATILVAIVTLALALAASARIGGNLEPSDPPDTTEDWSLDDIYNRLNDGTKVQSSTFTEPEAGPGTPTMHTLFEIYDLISMRAPPAKTGQTRCYTDQGNSEQDCPIRGFPGQDGTLQSGINWPQPRFTDNNDGTVTDNLTGLTWLKNANCAGVAVDWKRALTEVAQINYDGKMGGNDCGDTSNDGGHQKDWRMPNVNELQSLIHYGYVTPSLPDTMGTGQWAPGDPFDNVISAPYWTGTTSVTSHLYAFTVVLDNGLVLRDFKSIPRYVWPVRGGHHGLW